MRLNDAVFGVLLLLFAAAMMAYTRTFPEMPGQNYGPALFPLMIGGGLAVCGAALVVKGVRLRHSGPLVAFGDWMASPRHRVNFALIPALLLFYILAADFLGFIPCAVAILALLCIRFGAGWRASALTAVLATLAIHGFFSKFLLVPLPWGLLQPVAW